MQEALLQVLPESTSPGEPKKAEKDYVTFARLEKVSGISEMEWCHTDMNKFLLHGRMTGNGLWSLVQCRADNCLSSVQSIGYCSEIKFIASFGTWQSSMGGGCHI